MPSRLFRFFYGVLALATLALVGLGGYVRGTGAGLSCPDWPLCFGMAVPEQLLHPGVMQEVFHRYLASIVGMGTLALSVRAIRRRKIDPRLSKFSFWLLGVLGIQVVLGGLTVLMLLNPFIVTGHLFAGTLFFQSLAVVALSGPAPSAVPPSPAFMRLLGFFGAMVFLQLIIGGFVGSSGASLVCPDLPGCFNAMGPAHMSGAQTLHMFHRVLAIVILLFTAVVVRSGRNLGDGEWRLQLGVLVLTQIGLGIANVYFRVPVGVAVLHLVIAQLILLRILVLFLRLKGVQFFPAEDAAISPSSRVTGGAAQVIL